MDYKELSGNKRIKTNRKDILEKKKANEEAMKSASAEKDPLSSFPGFRFYTRDGLSVFMESGRGDKLSSSVKKCIQNLLKVNMEGPYGLEWQAEEKVKRREMVVPEARYIFVYESSTDSEMKSTSNDDCSAMVGFVHYRFVMEEEVPVLYVYELQIESRAQRKGLGKFLMHLIELIAKKNQMGAVLLTVQKGNSGAMSFYTTKLKYTVSTISPSRVNPSIGVAKSYEILCKTFGHKAGGILA